MQATGRSAESGHTGSTAASEPLRNTLADMSCQPVIEKKKPIAKKRKGEAEKLLAEHDARPTRRAMARQKEVDIHVICTLYLSDSYTYVQALCL